MTGQTEYEKKVERLKYLDAILPTVTFMGREYQDIRYEADDIIKWIKASWHQK